MKSIDTIIGIGAMFYRVDRSVLTSELRDRRTVRIRNSIIGVCRNECSYMLEEIGKAFERDHGTIMNSLKNLTPLYMGEMWRRHLAFMDVVKSADDRSVDLLKSFDVTIGEIDAKIHSLQEIRKAMADIRDRVADVPTEAPKHWNDGR